jgi:tRNA pseudouridine38-40 synthase
VSAVRGRKSGCETWFEGVNGEHAESGPRIADRGARNLKLTLAYDGTRFVGWQRQATGESIQGLLEDALSRLDGSAITVHGAGRTDAGVHAEGQVASARVTFAHDPSTVMRAVNAHLPPEIRVLAVDEAPAEFHARFSARSKSYRYQIANSVVLSPFVRAYAWHVPERLDREAMSVGAAALVGTHDFTSFQSTGSDAATTVRTLARSEFADRSGLLVYEVEGDGFLRHMVRAIVGTLVEVGRGWRPASDVQMLLKVGTRAQAGATAPAHGLTLVKVEY